MIKTTVKIEGMACSMCEAHINDAVRKAFPEAKKVASSRLKKETTFLTEEPVSEDKIREVISRTGYTFISCANEPYEKKRLFWK